MRIKPQLINSFFISFFFFVLVFNNYTVLAQESASPVIETTYTDTYRLGYNKDIGVSRQVTLTNTTAKLYVSEYEIAFSDRTDIQNISILEDGQAADYSQVIDSNKIKLRIIFKNPAIGRSSTKTITINYVLTDYLNQAGEHRELFIPVSTPAANENLQSYKVQVITPPDYPEVGLAKPNIKTVGENTYEWSNVLDWNNKALYLSFSQKAFYAVTLNYVLKNNAPYPRKTTIPYLPEGIFQKVYVTSISPLPDEVFLDDDHNYLGTYLIPGNSLQKVVFNGVVELSVDKREVVRQYLMKSASSQFKSRYLTQEKYWQLSADILAMPTIVALKTPVQIYAYVIERLSYDTNRINNDLKRMGAEWVFNNPNQAVCMEYTDLFIALAREKGIPAREVVGYAITNESDILPSSFLGDILHAWPEYFDVAREIWVPIDPTWADTAEIEYFSSFDLSHIAFVYHGKDTTYPLPPGVYKVNSKTKDIYVTGISEIPKERQKLNMVLLNDLNWVSDQTNKVVVQLSSDSNVFLYDLKLVLKDKNSQKTLSFKNLDIIEPLGEKRIEFLVKANKTKWESSGELEFYINQNQILQKNYLIRSRLNHFLLVYKWIVIGSITLIISLIIIKWRL